MLNNPSLNEINRLRDEFVNQSAKQIHWDDRMMQASKACEVWKSEADESNRKVFSDSQRAQLQLGALNAILSDRSQASEATKQRDDALNRVQLLTDKLEQVSCGQNGQITIPKDLRGLSIQKLKGLQVNCRRPLSILSED